MLSRLRTLLNSPATIRALTREADDYRARIARMSYDLTRARNLLIVADAERVHLRLELVRMTAEADAVAPVKRAVRPVSEVRRLAILRMVSGYPAFGATAHDIAREPCLGLDGLYASAERWVSGLAAEGWLVSNGKRPAKYRLTAMGRQALAPALVEVAS